jgi:hypothetical protein
LILQGQFFGDLNLGFPFLDMQAPKKPLDDSLGAVQTVTIRLNIALAQRFSERIAGDPEFGSRFVNVPPQNFVLWYVRFRADGHKKIKVPARSVVNISRLRELPSPHSPLKASKIFGESPPINRKWRLVDPNLAILVIFATQLTDAVGAPAVKNIKKEDPKIRGRRICRRTDWSEAE